MSVLSRRWLSLSLVVLATFGSCAYGALPAAGEQAPDFSLKNSTGINQRLSEYRSEVVLVNFWSSWCRSCRTQLQQMQLLFADADMDVEIVSIFVDEDVAAAANTVRDLNLTFPILFDDQQAVSRLYDLPTLPVALLLDRHGRVRFIHSGYKVGDEKFYIEELNQLLAE